MRENCASYPTAQVAYVAVLMLQQKAAITVTGAVIATAEAGVAAAVVALVVSVAAGAAATGTVTSAAVTAVAAGGFGDLGKRGAAVAEIQTRETGVELPTSS